MIDKYKGFMDKPLRDSSIANPNSGVFLLRMIVSMHRLMIFKLADGEALSFINLSWDND
jgi:hypothetical protein